jgi:hypothetical protein
VSIEVSGVDGKVTNLGQIIASAGTIGIGAALIDNSGMINASSVEREGGRIFLRASTHLTTGDGSEIEANGTTGGNIQLYSDGITNIRGNVSALGSAGNGGHVDTSGMAGLSVHYVPKIGAGGEWIIDPYDIDIVDGPDANGGILSGIPPLIDDAVALISGHATVKDGTINAQLSGGVNVTLTTGPSLLGTNGGRITLDSGAEIVKNGGGAATLTLNAMTDIDLNGSITDGSTGANANGLNLVLNANLSGSGGNVSAAGNITLGGNLTSHATAVTVSNGATINLNGSNNSFDSDVRMTGGTVNVNGGTIFQNVTVGGNSTLNLNAATDTINDAVVSNGTINVNATTTMHSLALTTSSASNVNLNANLTTAQLSLLSGSITANSTNASTFTVTDSFAQTAGSMNLKTAVLTQKSGNLQIGSGGIQADNLTLNADNGAVIQDGAITGGGTVAVQTAQGITLDMTGNSIANFSGTATNGDITLKTGNGAVTLGTVTANNGNVSVTNTDNNININGAISANAANKTVSLDAHAGILENETSGSITTTGLKVKGGGDLDFQAHANNVGSFSTDGTTSGNIYLNNTGDLTLGAITNTNTDVGVNVTTTGGEIKQSAGIVAKILNVTADKGITLANAGNSIGTFIARNIDSGVISLTNRSNQLLTLNGISNDHGSITIDTNAGLTAISGSQGEESIHSSTGAISLTSQGDMTLSEGISSSSGAITLNASAGSLTVNSGVSSTDGPISLTSQGNMILNDGISSSSGAISLESSAGSLTVNTGVSSTGGLVTLSSLNSLTIGGEGSVSGHDVSLTTTSGTAGDINIWGSLQATGEESNDGLAGNITIASGKGVSETNGENLSGSIIGNTLNVTATTDIGLRGDDTHNSVSSFTATSTQGGVELGNDGDLTLTGITASNGAVNIETNGNMTVDSHGITSGSSISLKTHSPMQAGFAFSHGGDDDGPPQAHADMTINGDLTAHSDIGLDSAGAITQTGGKISSTNGNVTLGANGNLTVGGDGITGQSLSLATYPTGGSKDDDDEPIAGPSSDIHINGQLTANGSDGIYLDSAGMILQNVTSGTGITTSALDANASTGITLNYSGNNVRGFTATNYGAGDIALTTASTSLTLSGDINNYAENGNVSITNNGVNNTGGDIIGLAVFDHETSKSTGATADGKVTYTSAFGNVTLSGVSSTDLEVNAQHGNVTLATDGVLSVTGTMNVSAGTGITIISGGCGTTHIANFTADNTGSGNITLANKGDIQLGAITNTGRSISISASNGSMGTTGEIKGASITLATSSDTLDRPTNLNIGSQLTGTDSVILNGGEVGSITEGANGGISTALLTATATKGITLDSANNTANGFAATNAHSALASADGDIKFVNNSSGTTSHTLTTHVVHTEVGNISIENTGAMVTTDLIDALAGTVSLRTHSPLTIGVGGVTASGNISLTAGGPPNSSVVDNLFIGGAVTSDTGSVGMVAGNNVTLDAVVSAPAGNFDLSLGGTLSTPVQQPVAPNVTHLAAPTNIDSNNNNNGNSAPPFTPPSNINNTVDQNVANASNNANNNNDTDVVLPITTTSAAQQTAGGNANQTVGGTDGEFGGSDTSKDDKKDTSGKPGKPLPICT